MASSRVAEAQTSNVRQLRRVNHVDGWSNVFSGINTARDRANANRFKPERYSQLENEELYRSSDMAARIVDTIPDEMCREGYELLVEEAKEIAESVTFAADALGVLDHVQEAERWKRAYGGAGIVMGVDDGQDPIEPLNVEAIKSFEWLTVLSPLELQPMAWYADPNAPKFGEPRIYRVQPLFTPGSGLIAISESSNSSGPYSLVHESRVIRFDGIKVSRRQLYEGFNYGWGDSVLDRCRRLLGRFDLSWDSAATLIEDFAQAVYKMKGLADLVASTDPADNAAVVKRMGLIDQSRSVLRGILLDADGEDFERKPTPITGLPDLLEKFCLRLAAAAGMPVALLMGQAPAGLNATGDSDIRWFYDKVAAQRRQGLLPKLRRILELLMRAKRGPTSGRVPANWSIKFPSLWQLSAKEQSEARLNVAQADNLYIQNGVVTPEEVAQSRFGGDEYSTEIVLDSEARDGMDSAAAALEGETEDPPSTSDPEAVNPKAALNGVQVTAMLQVVQAVADGEIPRDSGVAIITASFPVSAEEADAIMGSVGKDFEPKPKPTPPAMAPPGGPPRPPPPHSEEEEPGR